MPVNLSTTVKKIDRISNKENQLLVRNYHEFMKSCEVSERHLNNNLKVMLSFANYLDSDSENQVKFSDIKSSEIILRYLETKRKQKEDDPDQKWISTWNHYFHRIKHFFRWYYNSGYRILNKTSYDDNENHYQGNHIYEPENQNSWKTPEFL